MKDLEYYKWLGRLSESIIHLKPVLEENNLLRKKLIDVENFISQGETHTYFYDNDNLLENLTSSMYSEHEKLYFSSAMRNFSKYINKDIYLREVLNGSSKDKYDKIDFIVSINDLLVSIQFKARSYSSKKNYMDDTTLRDLDCLHGEADILLEVVYNDVTQKIVDQHFLNFKKLKSLIDEDILIAGYGRMSGWEYHRPSWFSKEGESPLDTQPIDYHDGRSHYYYLANSCRLGLDHPAHILVKTPNTNMISFPNRLLKELGVDFDNPDIVNKR